MKPLTMIELEDLLYSLARQSGCFDANVHPYIISEIVCQYAVKTDYYEQDAIDSMKRFLNKGTLSFERTQETKNIYNAMARAMVW